MVSPEILGEIGRLRVKFHPKFQVKTALPSFHNLGSVWDPQLSMDKHVSKVCSSTFYHLRNIASIRKCLTTEVSEGNCSSFWGKLAMTYLGTSTEHSGG